MRDFNEWLAAYAESHQNPTNELIHKVCAPVIFFTIVALLWKFSFLLFVVAAAGVLAFYYLLGKEVAILGAGMILASLLLQWVSGVSWIGLIILCAMAVAAQFHGYRLEGKKLSFIDTVKFLLIGPLWAAQPLFQYVGLERTDNSD